MTISDGVIALVEINLSPEVLDSELDFQGFTGVINRSSSTSKRSGGGGA